MFSGRNTYLIPATSAADLDGVEILLHHHHHHQFLHHHHHHQPDAFSGLYLAANAPPDAAAVFEGAEASASAAAPARKQAVKKDRHSKIQTAQGPRDRRVRLSIGIARKFFDLQEMLGFDKPSKTLDWLLTKSKAAIKELVHASAASSPSACEIDQSGAADSSRKSGKAASKETRAKARARARERTLEKMCIKQLGGSDQNHASSSSFDQCSRNNQLEFLQLSAGSATAYHLPLPSEQDLIQDSVVIKRKNKNNNNPSSLLGFHQNLVLNSNYTTIPSANTATHDNWDVFGQSNLHAAFDHHKFFN